MELIKSIYQENPEFVNDVLHLHFFKTQFYYTERMEGLSRLEISRPLMVYLFMVDYATSYSIENGVYKFNLELNFLGNPERIPFQLLFNELINTCFSCNNIEDMYDKLYKSEKAILIILAEQFKDKNALLSSDLFKFIKRRECSPFRYWEITELLGSKWNYTLLALNNRVWETAFDNIYIANLFQKEKVELDRINEGNLLDVEYPNYLARVDSLIKEKLG